MRSCIILGSGRSGTSLMGGILHSSGYYMGENLYPPRYGNPKGFFENKFINGINEKILKRYDLKKWNDEESGNYTVNAPAYGQRWLMAIDEQTEVQCDNESVLSDIKLACSHSAFAYKDPRFSYTLPVWRNFLPNDSRYIVMFRDPRKTVESILRECQSVDYLSNLNITEQDAFFAWQNIYRHVLKNYNTEPSRFIVINFEALILGCGFERIEDFIDCSLSRLFIEKKLNRSEGKAISMPKEAEEIYNQLMSIAI